MTEDELKTEIRNGIRETRPTATTNAAIDQAIADAINIFGNIIYGRFPEYFETRKSLQHSEADFIFDAPSGYGATIEIIRIWDMDTNAIEISATADNGSSVVRVTTASAHGFEDENIITVHDVATGTEANGTWEIDYQSTTTFDLVGCTYAAVGSGGYCFKECDDFQVIPRMPAKESQLINEDSLEYYTRGSKIIIDDTSFDNDIIVLYRTVPSTLATIPAQFHPGIVSYAVTKTIKLPNMPNLPGFHDLQMSYQVHSASYQYFYNLAMNWAPVREGHNISDVKRINAKAINRWI